MADRFMLSWIQELVQRFEEMGITVDLNINLYELDVEMLLPEEIASQ